MRRILILVVLLAATGAIHAQDTRSPVIDAENVERLQPAAQIDFEAFQADAGRFQTGWFVMDEHGERYAAVNSQSQMVTWDIEGQLENIYSAPRVEDIPPTFVDADLSEGTLTAVYDGGSMYYVATMRGKTTDILMVDSDNTPIGVWVDEASTWLEILPQDATTAPFVLNLPYESMTRDAVTEADLAAVPYGPAGDPEAVVRIGRIPSPFAITSSAGGTVKRWDLRTGAVTIEAQVQGGPAVFGQINVTGTHLVWRDNASTALYLLNLETGENRPIAPLDGQYVQWFFVTPKADVILAVNIGLEPVVVAWDVASGKRHDLGAYRGCGRVPDMARLSRDGTTLAIGCDTGLDIWRIGQPT